MADMHVIRGNGRGDWLVVMHFDIPNVNNSVGLNVRTALIRSGLISESVLDEGDGLGGTISTDEALDLANGAILEKVIWLPLDGVGTTNSSRVDLLRERYTAIAATINADLISRLRFFGFNQART